MSESVANTPVLVGKLKITKPDGTVQEIEVEPDAFEFNFLQSLLSRITGKEETK